MKSKNWKYAVAVLILCGCTNQPARGKEAKVSASDAVLAQQEQRIKKLFGAYFDPETSPAACVQKGKPSLGPLHAKNGDLSPEEFSEIIEGTYPRHWTEGVSSITQSKAKRPLYPLLGKFFSSPMSFAWISLPYVVAVNDGNGGIVFFNASLHESVRNLIDRDLHHELAHANSWASDNGMTASERADLLLAVYDRLGAKDRYRSYNAGYAKDDDPQAQAYRKAAEYWADIMAQYFADPSRLAAGDLRLAEGYVKRIDPEFDWSKAKQKREELIQEAIAKHRGRSS